MKPETARSPVMTGANATRVPAFVGAVATSERMHSFQSCSSP
jgi:hypothetical protein